MVGRQSPCNYRTAPPARPRVNNVVFLVGTDSGATPAWWYLSRYAHRVAISNSCLIKADATSVTFKVTNYRVQGPARYTTMTPEWLGQVVGACRTAPTP
jgi:hypothetical protein